MICHFFLSFRFTRKKEKIHRAGNAICRWMKLNYDVTASQHLQLATVYIRYRIAAVIVKAFRITCVLTSSSSWYDMFPELVQSLKCDDGVKSTICTRWLTKLNHAASAGEATGSGKNRPVHAQPKQREKWLQSMVHDGRWSLLKQSTHDE